MKRANVGGGAWLVLKICLKGIYVENMKICLGRSHRQFEYKMRLKKVKKGENIEENGSG